MLSTDSNLIRKITNYYRYVLKYGIALQNDVVEIVGSSYVNDEISILKNLIYQMGAKRVVVTHNDGVSFEKEINDDWQVFLANRIRLYKDLVAEGFVRIALLSPFVSSVTRTNSLDNYKANLHKFKFVQDYLTNGTRRTTIAIPNSIWANKLGLSLDELWNNIIDFSFEESNLDHYKDYLSNIGIKKLYFKTSLGTNMVFDLIELPFLGKKSISKESLEFEINIPCKEICTSPYKYGVNGVLVASKPLNYKGHIYNNIRLEFKDGYLINNNGVDDIIDLDDSLRYVGETAIVIPSKYNMVFYNTLLDENLGSHIALGNSLHINNDNTNKSNYHIDIVFGTDDIDCYYELEDGRIEYILKNGRFMLNGR